MELKDAKEKACQIAELIINGSRKLGRTPVGQLPLLSMLPLMGLSSGVTTVEQLDPTISEILVYGSIARGEEEVGDIDMMILDRGFYSSFFKEQLEDGNRSPDRNKSRFDLYRLLSDNLNMLLTGWMGYKEDEEGVVAIADIAVDLHVLPLTLLTHGNVRNEIAGKHSDPKFLQNAFSSVLRYDRATRTFEEIEIGYLEKRYDCDLSDLRD